MNLKTLLVVGLLAIIGYYGYDFAVTQFSQPAMAYKRYATAVLDNDRTRAKALVIGDDALAAFAFNNERQSWLNGEHRFVWYTFLDQRMSGDGDRATLVVRQTVRVDPPGSDSFFGTEVRQDRHFVTLEQDQSSWKVVSFEDSAMQAGHSNTAAWGGH